MEKSKRQKDMDNWEKRQVRKLLDEIDNMKGPGELEAWNIKAQTLLVFAAMRRPETFLSE